MECKQIKILDLPCETLIQIFEYLSFEEVAKSRIICKRIDDICQKILNRGFKRASHESAMAYKRIKSLLPRRESERRNHALVRHADILSSVETRLSMLSMTYTKYIDLNMCCFIPGRVLDEIFNILRLTKQRCVSLRPLEILQEFRDISSMAIEHFDEHIASEFKRSLERNTFLKVQSGSLDMHTSESECGASELLWVRKYGRSSFVTPLTTIHTLPDKVQTMPANETDQESKVGATYSRRGRRRTAESAASVFKRMEKTIAGLEKKQIKQNKYYKRELYRLNRNFCLVKRRLDEMDSKYKELIETVRQYKIEPSTSQSTTAGTSKLPTTVQPSTATNTTNNNEETIKNSEVVASAPQLLNEHKQLELESVDDMNVDIAADASTNAAATLTCSNGDKSRIKRPWVSDAIETLSKKKRNECD